jgi:hypothetical protein
MMLTMSSRDWACARLLHSENIIISFFYQCAKAAANRALSGFL